MHLSAVIGLGGWPPYNMQGEAELGGAVALQAVQCELPAALFTDASSVACNRCSASQAILMVTRGPRSARQVEAKYLLLVTTHMSWWRHVWLRTLKS